MSSNTFTFLPSYGISLTKSPRVNILQYGDGYQFRTLDGINSNPRRWQLTFNRVLSEAEQIDTFLENLKGKNAFTWTPPDGKEGRFVCNSWSVNYSSFNFASVDAVFEEVYGI